MRSCIHSLTIRVNLFSSWKYFFISEHRTEIFIQPEKKFIWKSELIFKRENDVIVDVIQNSYKCLNEAVKEWCSQRVFPFGSFFKVNFVKDVRAGEERLQIKSSRKYEKWLLNGSIFIWWKTYIFLMKACSTLRLRGQPQTVKQ